MHLIVRSLALWSAANALGPARARCYPHARVNNKPEGTGREGG